MYELARARVRLPSANRMIMACIEERAREKVGADIRGADRMQDPGQPHLGHGGCEV